MNDNMQTRKTLLERVADPHDDLSWDEFYNFYKDYVFVIVVNMGVDRHNANDLVQEIFVKAWKALPDFDYSSRKGRFRSWIATITKNTVRTRFRDSSRRPQTDELGEDLFRHEAQINKIIEVEWKKFVASKALETIKSEFSEKYIEAFIDLMHGMKVTDAAEKYGLKEPTLHVYKTRIQKRLCREIKRLNYELN
jgi:RNA polymerase sigma-70 factor (ECF subfamily)